MKVLHICQRDDLATGGAARVAVEFTKRLPDHGVEALCVFVYGGAGPFSDEIPGKCRHLGLRSSREALSGFPALRRLIVSEGADLLHHHDGLIWTHLVSRSLPRLIKVGHGHLSPPPCAGSLRNRIAHQIQSTTYEHLVAVSQSTREDWIAQGFPQAYCTVLANGVDVRRFHPASAEERERLRRKWSLTDDAKAIGLVGRLDSAMKGCREFVELIAALPANFTGVVAGEGPDRSELQTYARELGLEGRVLFLGVVDPAREVYPGLDVFVMTSSYEPFGLVLLEAASSGLPIAMIPGSGGSLELGRRLGAVILEDRSIPPFAAAVRTLAVKASPGPVRPSDDVFADYSWDSAAARLSGLYASLLRVK